MYYAHIIFVLPTPRMSESCAVHPDGTLKDASEIQWFNNPDVLPIHPPTPVLPVADGTHNAFVRKDSSIVQAESLGPLRRSVPATFLQSVPLLPLRMTLHPCCQANDDDGDGSSVLEDLSGDEEDGDKEDTYERMKKLGDQDRNHCRGLKKQERSTDLMTVFTQEKDRINPVTNEREDDW